MGLCDEDSLLAGERNGGGRGKEDCPSGREQLVPGSDRKNTVWPLVSVVNFSHDVMWRMRPFRASIHPTLSKQLSPIRTQAGSLLGIIKGSLSREDLNALRRGTLSLVMQKDRREHPTQVLWVMIRSPAVQGRLSLQPWRSVLRLAALHRLSPILIFFERQQFPSSASGKRLQRVPAIVSLLASTDPSMMTNPFCLLPTISL